MCHAHLSALKLQKIINMNDKLQKIVNMNGTSKNRKYERIQKIVSMNAEISETINDREMGSQT